MNARIKWIGSDSIMIESTGSHATPWQVITEQGVNRERVRFDNYREACYHYKNEYLRIKNIK
jgi:hypothetical protein